MTRPVFETNGGMPVEAPYLMPRRACEQTYVDAVHLFQRCLRSCGTSLGEHGNKQQDKDCSLLKISHIKFHSAKIPYYFDLSCVYLIFFNTFALDFVIRDIISLKERTH